MPQQWRAVDVEDHSRWRSDRELAIRDAITLIQAGEEDVVVEWRIATEPMHSDIATFEARERAGLMDRHRIAERRWMGR